MKIVCLLFGGIMFITIFAKQSRSNILHTLQTFIDILETLSLLGVAFNCE